MVTFIHILVVHKILPRTNQQSSPFLPNHLSFFINTLKFIGDTIYQHAHNRYIHIAWYHENIFRKNLPRFFLFQQTVADGTTIKTGLKHWNTSFIPNVSDSCTCSYWQWRSFWYPIIFTINRPFKWPNLILLDIHFLSIIFPCRWKIPYHILLLCMCLPHFENGITSTFPIPTNHFISMLHFSMFVQCLTFFRAVLKNFLSTPWKWKREMNIFPLLFSTPHTVKKHRSWLVYAVS